MHSSADGFLFILLFLGMLIVAFRRPLMVLAARQRHTEPDESGEASAIIAYYAAGHALFNITRGKTNDMAYSVLMTGPSNHPSDAELQYTTDSAVVYTLDLPFNTEGHLVGLSKQYTINRLQFEAFLKQNGMEKVTLEGDFSDHFDIYAAQGQQFQVRYILDPAAMAFVAEYCTDHFWEINNAELYFVSTSSDKNVDDNMIQESQQFVDQIKPALLPGEPGAPVVHHDVPYGEYDGPALGCPICTKPMTQTDDLQVCPDNHGVLVNGRDLQHLAHGDLAIPLAIDNTQPHQALTCPNCHNQMLAMGYEDGPIQINSCTHCVFRWLDAKAVLEFAAVAARN